MKLRILDLETTGMEPPHEVVEIAAIDFITGADRPVPYGETLVKPGIPIPPEAMAVHHITNEMVADAPSWADVAPRLLDEDRSQGVDFFVAHNARFEAQWIADRLQDRPLLCTFKTALRVYPHAPGHSNQVLRYFLGLEVGPEGFPPHRALPDCHVTAPLLINLLKHCGLNDMIQWSAEPPDAQ